VIQRRDRGGKTSKMGPRPEVLPDFGKEERLTKRTVKEGFRKDECPKGPRTREKKKKTEKEEKF